MSQTVLALTILFGIGNIYFFIEIMRMRRNRMINFDLYQSNFSIMGKLFILYAFIVSLVFIANCLLNELGSLILAVLIGGNLVVLLSQIIITIYYSLKKDLVSIINKIRQIERNRFFFLLIINLCFFVSFLIYRSSEWVIQTFGDVNIEQLLFQANNLEGSDTTLVLSFFRGPFLTTLFAQIFFYPICLIFCVISFQNKALKFITQFFTVLVIGTFFIFLGIKEIGYQKFVSYFSKSDFIQVNYVDAAQTNISFPDQKRNLIYIFVESLETTYSSKSDGGFETNNLIQPLTDILNEDAINFSNSDRIGGALQLPGMEYTAGAIVAQTSGLPIKTTEADANLFGTSSEYVNGEKRFLPGLTSIGEILEENGYKNEFIMGSDANFGGRKSYLSAHGNYEILDYYEAKKRGLIPEDYSVWWGFEDTKLFDFAKMELNTLSSSNQPFNLTLLTADMHAPDGLLYSDTTNIEDNQYKSVIAHSANMIAEFIRWCQEQPWYENTTIVLSGDHLTMAQSYSQSISENYQRTIFNLFINTNNDSIDSTIYQNRQFSNVDIFPTVIASLGGEIDGEKLGLGVNLFSDEKTLIEKYSYEFVDDELRKKSKFYKNKISNDS